jgi:hypothetical protein
MRNRWMARALWTVFPLMTIGAIGAIVAHVDGPPAAAETPSLSVGACDYGCLTAIRRSIP